MKLFSDYTIQKLINSLFIYSNNMDDTQPKTEVATNINDELKPLEVYQTFDVHNAFQRALDVVKKYVIQFKHGEESGLITLLDDIKEVDPAKVLAIAQIVKYKSTFCEMVRENVSDMHYATRYDDIRRNLNSVITDAKMLVDELKDGKIDTKEKLQNLWMRIMRGTTHNRFEKVRNIHQAVSHDVKGQLDAEDEIIQGYINYRISELGAKSLSYQVLDLQKTRLEVSRTGLSASQTAYESIPEEDKAKKADMQLKRDDAQRVYDIENKNYDIIKDTAEGISESHDITDMLQVTLKQNNVAKQAIYRRFVICYETSEALFTTLDAIYQQMGGLHEVTESQKAWREGIDNMVKDVSEMSPELQKRATREGYGTVYSYENLKGLVDNAIRAQIEFNESVDKYRAERTDEVRAVEEKVASGRKALVDVISKHNPNYLPAPSAD
jgi:hypothetical protein